MDAREECYHQQLGVLQALLSLEAQLKEQIALRREIVSQLQAVLGIVPTAIPQPVAPVQKPVEQRRESDSDPSAWSSLAALAVAVGVGMFDAPSSSPTVDTPDFSGGGGDFGGGGSSGDY